MNNGWVTCDFMSFSTVFQLYQDDEPMIMKDYVQWDPVTIKQISASGNGNSVYQLNIFII